MRTHAYNELLSLSGDDPPPVSFLPYSHNSNGGKDPPPQQPVIDSPFESRPSTVRRRAQSKPVIGDEAPSGVLGKPFVLGVLPVGDTYYEASVPLRHWLKASCLCAVTQEIRC